ncbi:hypothetical protein ABTX60_28610 [Streptomyces sp. NPDC126510]|uniref:hypothetical protein n=1 Tax=Streptomyces sp. NPDC126510 TaxID=3155317 RepID=UPI003318D0B6
MAGLAVARASGMRRAGAGTSEARAGDVGRCDGYTRDGLPRRVTVQRAARLLADALIYVPPRRFYRQVLGYTGGIVALGPVVAWGALVLPWS